MIFIIKHQIALALTVVFGCLYGYCSAEATNAILAMLYTLMYAAALIAIYTYVYNTASNRTKLLGVVITLVTTSLGLYIAWVVWVIVRSDEQLYLFCNPIELWNNLMTLATDSNVKLVHGRYAGADCSPEFIYTTWIVEVIVTVVFPTIFALQAITTYSDDNLSTEELHKEFGKE